MSTDAAAFHTPAGLTRTTDEASLPSFTVDPGTDRVVLGASFPSHARLQVSLDQVRGKSLEIRGNAQLDTLRLEIEGSGKVQFSKLFSPNSTLFAYASGTAVLDFWGHPLALLHVERGRLGLLRATRVQDVHIKPGVERFGATTRLPQLLIDGSPALSSVTTDETTGYRQLDGTLEVGRLRLGEQAQLNGKCTAKGIECVSGSLRLAGELELANPGAVKSVTFLPQPGVTPRLSVDTACEDMSFTGPGELHARGGLFRCAFSASGSSPEALPSLFLSACEGIEIEGKLRAVTLDEGDRRRLRLTAGPSGLQVSNLHGGYRWTIEGIDGYRLSEHCIAELEVSTRLDPVFASTARKRKRSEEARHKEWPGNSDEQHRRSIAYWSRLAALLTSQRAPAHLQSNTRVAAMRARRRGASVLTRDRWVLSAYAFVGYGERILQPLLCLIALTGIAGGGMWLLAVGDGHQRLPLSALMGYALAAPLEIFRITELPDTFSATAASLWIIGTIKLLGAVCIGFVLVALRRTVQIGRE